jgi:hypothetical protein
MWFGSGGEKSVLHNDLQDNLLHVVRGEKRVVLYAPNQTRFLYENRDFERTETRVSPILNVDQANLTKYPLFAEAKGLEVTVKKGQVLFIPALWWHEISSIGKGKEGVLAVNIWWDHFNYAQNGLQEVYQTPSDELAKQLLSRKPLCRRK